MDDVEAGNQDTPRKIEVTPQDFSIEKPENERVGDKTRWSGKGQKWIMIVGFLLAIITLALAGYIYFLQ